MHCLWDKFGVYIHGWFYVSNSLFRTVEVTKNVGTDKYSYSGYGIACDAHRSFSLFNGSRFDKNVIFGADISSSVHIVNKMEDMLILVKGPTDVLDDCRERILYKFYQATVNFV